LFALSCVLPLEPGEISADLALGEHTAQAAADGAGQRPAQADVEPEPSTGTRRVETPGEQRAEARLLAAGQSD